MPKVGFHIDTDVGVNGDKIEMSRKSSQYSQKENPHQGSSGSEISTMSKECRQASKQARSPLAWLAWRAFQKRFPNLVIQSYVMIDRRSEWDSDQ